jgi:hypothetical protein
MKMKKIILICSIAVTVALTGCLKDDPNVDLSNVGTVVELPYSGLSNFGGDALNLKTDTVQLTFTLNIASPYPPDHDIQVTVGVDPSLTAAFNSSHTDQYQNFPADAYVFADETVTIEKGTRLDSFTVTFYKQFLDPTISYMLPITIKDASGETISGNFATHYYHFIGNPIAGDYLWDFKRWPLQTPTGSPDISWDAEPITFAPDNPTTVEMPSGYYTQGNYVLSFTNNSGVLSDFHVVLSNSFLQDFAGAGITVTDGPNIMMADPITGVYEFQYSVFNGSAFRYVVDKYYRP